MREQPESPIGRQDPNAEDAARTDGRRSESRGYLPETGFGGALASCLTLGLGGIVLLLGAMVVLVLAALNAPFAASIGPALELAGVLLLIAAAPFVLIAFVIRMLIGRRASCLPKLILLVTVVVVGTWLLMGAQNATKPRFSPQIAGVVRTSAWFPSEHLYHVTLESGQALLLGYSTSPANPSAYLHVGEAHDPNPGSLVLAGDQNGRWWASTKEGMEQGAGFCYWLEASGYAKPDSVELDDGMVLRYSDRPTAYRTDREYHFAGYVCFDASGRVDSVYSGA